MWGQPPSAVRGAKLRECLSALKGHGFKGAEEKARIEAALAAEVTALSLLKQILKRRPCVIRSQAGRGRSLFFPRHPNLIRRTLIPLIFLRHPLLHRLHALKPAPRIEIRTLLARMQLKLALRTLPIPRTPLQYRPTLRAPGDRPRPRQIHRTRPQRVVPLRRTARAFGRSLPRFLPRFLAPFVFVVPISVLSVFRHKPSPPGPYCLPDPTH
jgi:hypothetical protein